MFNLTKAMMKKNKVVLQPLPSESFSNKEAEIIANTMTGDSGSNRTLVNNAKKEAEKKIFMTFNSNST